MKKLIILTAIAAVWLSVGFHSNQLADIRGPGPQGIVAPVSQESVQQVQDIEPGPLGII